MSKITDILDSSVKPIELNEIKFTQFEAEVAGWLPSDYSDFLRLFNGVGILPNRVFVSDEVGSSSVHHMYGFGLVEYPYKSLERVLESFNGRLPKPLIPIADDEGGNQFCLAVSGGDQGKILYWDHETESLQAIVSDNFTGFINSLVLLKPSSDVDEILEGDNLEAFKNFYDTLEYPENHLDDMDRTLLERAVIKGSFHIVKYLLGINFPLGTSGLLAKRNAQFFPSTHAELAKLFDKGN